MRGASRFSGLEKPSKNRTICIRGGRKRPASSGSHKSARSSLKYGDAGDIWIWARRSEQEPAAVEPKGRGKQTVGRERANAVAGSCKGP